MKFAIYFLWSVFLLQGVTARLLLSKSRPCQYYQVEYADGASVPSNSPCTVCKCYTGEVSCSAITCPPPPKGCLYSPTRTRCCDYECGCMLEGKEYSNGDFVLRNNTCETCKCFNGTVHCSEFKECVLPMPGCERVFSETKCCAYKCSGEQNCTNAQCEPPPQGCTLSPQPHDCCAYTCCSVNDCAVVKCMEPPKGCISAPHREKCCNFECHAEPEEGTENKSENLAKSVLKPFKVPDARPRSPRD